MRIKGFRLSDIVGLLSLLLAASCSEHDGNSRSGDQPADKVNVHSTPGGGDICWTGMINGKIPVLLHYSIHDKLVVGAISYLNTVGRTPITVLGDIDEDGSYRLLEFARDGNITGIITGTPSEQAFDGSWFSPKTRKELSMSMSRKDTVIAGAMTDVGPDDIYGSYHYQYSDEGVIGDLEISRVGTDKAAFSIFSVTGTPGRNIADVADTIAAPSVNSFVYKLPDTASCEFEVRFYRGFAVVTYTNGYCEGQFGMNATIDGIFLKTD